jgi:hypothetical protein
MYPSPLRGTYVSDLLVFFFFFAKVSDLLVVACGGQMMDSKTGYERAHVHVVAIFCCVNFIHSLKNWAVRSLWFMIL